MTTGPGPILVVGAGAIGGYLGARLASAGHEVALVTRPPTVDRINIAGLRVTEAGATLDCHVPAFSDTQAALETVGVPRLVVLSMKGYDLADALEPLAGLPATTHFLTTQNGIGIEEIVASRYGKDRVLSAAVTIPIRKESPAHLVAEKSDRGIGLASVLPGAVVATEWAELLTAARLRTRVLPDYQAMKWSKAFLNVMGNATSAILGMAPAQIIRDRAGFQLEMTMLDEMLAVMDQAHLRIVNLPGAGVTSLAAGVRLLPRALMRGIMEQVARHGRGDKMPSFYLDLYSGVGKSEVVFHNGAIADAGRRLSVPTPVNRMLNDVLLAMTESRMDPSEYAGRPDRLLAAARGERSPT